MKLSTVSRNAAADAVLARLNGGLLRLYTGPQPSSPQAPAVGTLLAELPFGAPAFAPAVGGVARANSIARRAAISKGRAGWFRATAADGTPVYDGTVGTTGADLTVSNQVFEVDSLIVIESLTYTQPGG